MFSAHEAHTDEDAKYAQAQEQARKFFSATGSASHTNNWAVLVCASRYWFNYRHMANTLGMYRTVKRLGVPDSNIILMLADDMACNTRNKAPGSVYANSKHLLDLYGDNIEVDYRGYEVTVENVIRVLTGRVPDHYPRSKRLLSDERSNIFFYLTGHGGNEFLKFQDNEEISAFDVADAFETMWQKKRYNEIFFMIDTCQANTMYSKFYSPNIIATGSSRLGESSYSFETDYDLGTAVIDSYTHGVLQYLEGINKTSTATIQDLFNAYDPVKMKSHPGIDTHLSKRPVNETLLTDFFGAVARVEVDQSSNDYTSLYLDEVENAASLTPQTNESVVRVLSRGGSHEHTPAISQDASWARAMRTWGGMSVLLVLLGGVLVSSKRRATVTTLDT